MKTKIFSIVAADALPELVWYYNSMENYWLSDVNYQKSVVKNINEMRNQRMQGTVAPAEREFADSLLAIVKKYGKLSNNDGNGIWVGYVPESENENYEIGVRCENCILHESKSVCKIVKQRIQPGGYCRLAAIPDGVVGSSQDDEDSDEE
jgi:hypothetical protein